MPYGPEYVVISAQEPNVYVIRKQLRVSPDKMVPLAAYYVLDGSIYQAPHLQAVLGSRAVRRLNCKTLFSVSLGQCYLR